MSLRWQKLMFLSFVRGIRFVLVSRCKLLSPDGIAQYSYQNIYK